MTLATGALVLSLLAGAAFADKAMAIAVADEDAAFSLALEAYVWGYPLVISAATELVATDVDKPLPNGHAPINMFGNVAKLFTAADTDVVSSNVDTVYSSAFVDLKQGAALVSVPDTNGRYYSLMLEDAYTNVFGYVGLRATGDKAGKYLITGPDWTGTPPAGIQGVIASPTTLVWIIGRTLVDDEADLVNVRAIQSQYQIEMVPPAIDASAMKDRLGIAMTDVLARIAYADGTVEITRITPEAPAFTVQGAQGFWQVAATYFRLGVDHILSGYDHLLFVFALILLIRDRWMLLKTITAFTVAHSITLAGVTLGFFSLPQRPVEAAIALSIAFLAVELVKAKPGQLRLSERAPWLVAFAFGLLHGFGFAGALKETGLPQSDVPAALLTFNLGVEAGQLMFIAVVLVIFRTLGARVPHLAPSLRRLAAYSIGTASMFWLISRMVGFVA